MEIVTDAFNEIIPSYCWSKKKKILIAREKETKILISREEKEKQENRVHTIDPTYVDPLLLSYVFLSPWRGK